MIARARKTSLGALLATVVLCGWPTTLARAQSEILVLVSSDAHFRELLDIELGARGLRARFELPDASDLEAHVVAAEVEAGLALEPDALGGIIVSAFRREGGATARWRWAPDAGAEDARVVAVVSAALVDELLAAPSLASPTEPPIAPAPEPDGDVATFVAAGTPLLATPPRVRTIHFYSGVSVGAWARLQPSLDASLAARTSLGVQWQDGLRIGLVGQLDGYAYSADGNSHYDPLGAGGIELGGRFEHEVLAFHVGAHALVGGGQRRVVVESDDQLIGIAGGYVGLGVLLTEHVELGVRIEAEAWFESGQAPSPTLRASLRLEMR